MSALLVFDSRLVCKVTTIFIWPVSNIKTAFIRPGQLSNQFDMVTNFMMKGVAFSPAGFVSVVQFVGGGGLVTF